MKLVFVSLILVAFLGVQTAFGCSCGVSEEGLKLSNVYKAADGVVLGKIVSRDDERYGVKVDRVWKGIVESEILAVDIYDGTSCGLDLKKGLEQYFFLYSTNSESGGSKGVKYRNTADQTRIKNRQVFFVRPCVPIIEASVWDGYLREYDKSGFWQTLGEGEKPVPASVKR